MENRKLTRKEYLLCEVLSTGFIARDRFKRLHYFVNKPIRNKGDWYGGDGLELRPTIFPSFDFISWEDEPIKVEDLLEIDWES